MTAYPQSSRSLRIDSLLNHPPPSETHGLTQRPENNNIPLRSVAGSYSPNFGHEPSIRTLPPTSSSASLRSDQQNEPLGYGSKDLSPDSISLLAKKSPNRISTPYPSYGHTARSSAISSQQWYNSFYSQHALSAPHLGAQDHRHNVSQNGTGNHQTKILDTNQGSIQELDQTTSQTVKERRRRGAGASYRFRCRRKEKEKEALQTIQQLETKLRNVGEEKEYYRIERDYFRDLVYSSPAQIHVTPRLPSPKHRQLSEDSNGSQEWHQNGERGSNEPSGPPPSTEPKQQQGPLAAQYPPEPYSYSPTRQQPGPPPTSDYEFHQSGRKSKEYQQRTWDENRPEDMAFEIWP